VDTVRKIYNPSALMGKGRVTNRKSAGKESKQKQESGKERGKGKRRAGKKKKASW